MAKRDEPSVRAFLERGLLPDNTPPLVTSRHVVGPTIGDEGSYAVTAGVLGYPSPFNASKRGFQRRTFSIPHPIFVRDAAVFFKRHWTAIEAHFRKAEGSASRPIFAQSRTRALRFTAHARLPALRLKTLARFRYCLVTDVSRCFPSIYTHSIPWALHGKEAAKTDRKPTSAKIFGNRLDYIVRQSQDGQTMGLPVGPDSSRVIAEIILTSADASFQKEHGAEGYLRHVDDYWIGGKSIEECDEKLQSLRLALNGFSLDINEHKTRIIPTSSVIAETWPYGLESQLEATLEQGDIARYEGRIISLLGSIVEHSSKSQDDGIVKFFLRRLDQWQSWDNYWELLEDFLAHCAVQFPHSFDYVAQVVSWRARTNRGFDKNLWFNVTRDVIRSAAATGRDAEVLWGLWLGKELGMKISGKTFDSMVASNGPLVVGALAHFAAHGLITTKVSLGELWAGVEGRKTGGREWPLALELTHLGVKPPPNVDLGGPQALTSIFTAGATLIDWDAHPLAFIDDDNLFDPNPASALRDTSSSYDDDDDDWPDLDDDAPF